VAASVGATRTTTRSHLEADMALTSSFKLPGYNWRRGKSSWDKHTWLYVAVIIAVVLGAVVGLVWPEFAKGLEPVGKAFVNLIKMMIAPIIFCTIVVGWDRSRKRRRSARSAASRCSTSS
jgi:hypothetical protein